MKAARGASLKNGALVIYESVIIDDDDEDEDVDDDYGRGAKNPEKSLTKPPSDPSPPHRLFFLPERQFLSCFLVILSHFRPFDPF